VGGGEGRGGGVVVLNVKHRYSGRNNVDSMVSFSIFVNNYNNSMADFSHFCCLN
jgi:hypothetical protein